MKDYAGPHRDETKEYDEAREYVGYDAEIECCRETGCSDPQRTVGVGARHLCIGQSSGGLQYMLTDDIGLRLEGEWSANGRVRNRCVIWSDNFFLGDILVCKADGP